MPMVRLAILFIALLILNFVVCLHAKFPSLIRSAFLDGQLGLFGLAGFHISATWGIAKKLTFWLVSTSLLLASMFWPGFILHDLTADSWTANDWYTFYFSMGLFTCLRGIPAVVTLVCFEVLRSLRIGIPRSTIGDYLLLMAATSLVFSFPLLLAPYSDWPSEAYEESLIFFTAPIIRGFFLSAAVTLLTVVAVWATIYPIRKRWGLGIAMLFSAYLTCVFVASSPLDPILARIRYATFHVSIQLIIILAGSIALVRLVPDATNKKKLSGRPLAETVTSN